MKKTIDRRRFLEVLAAGGVAIPTTHWLFTALEAYAQTRLTTADVRGPGIVRFENSICRECTNHCPIATRKVDGLPIGFRGVQGSPITEGALCMVGSAKMQAVFDADRLAFARIRESGPGPAQEIDPREGMAALRDRVRELVESGRGDRIAILDGRTPSLGTRLTESWAAAIPGAHYVPVRIERLLDSLYAEFLGADEEKGRLALDIEETGTLLLVGFELLESDGSAVTQMRAHGNRRYDPRFDHAPTIALGPRKGPTATKADLWVECVPGSEREIVLGLAEWLARKHPQHDTIFARYAEWVPEARDHDHFLREFSLQRVADRHGLDSALLERVAASLGRSHPAVALAGPTLLRQENGGSDVRATLALNLWLEVESLPMRWEPNPVDDAAAALGIDRRVPVARRRLQPLLDSLLELKRSEIEILICVECNPILDLPGEDQIKRAMSHVPFLVSIGSHADETAELSHLTLPSRLDVESWDLPDPAWGVPAATMMVQRPSMIPVLDIPSANELFLDLRASSSPSGPGLLDEQALVVQGAEALLRRRSTRLQPLSGAKDGDADLDAFLAGGAVLHFDPGPQNSQPGQRPPVLDAARRRLPDLAPRQLWLQPFDTVALRGGRTANRSMMMELSGYWHSLSWQSWVEIHPEDAHERGLRHGDHARVRGPRAEWVTRIVVTEDVIPGVVGAPVGFGHQALGKHAKGVGKNPLAAPYARFDSLTGAPVWGPVPVFLDKA